MHIVDLSVPVQNGSSCPPSAKAKVEITPVYRKPGHWQASIWKCTLHTGTHVDSPLHVFENTETIGEVGLDRVVGEAVKLELPQVKPNYEIGVADLEPFESELKQGDIVVFQTGWTDAMWEQDGYWTESPYLAEDAARWLAEREPKAICFDYFQEYAARLPDFKPDDFVVHKAILGKGILIVEHLTNLKSVPKRFQFFAAPAKIMDAEAAPTRAIAVL